MPYSTIIQAYLDLQIELLGEMPKNKIQHFQNLELFAEFLKKVFTTLYSNLK